jgi:hypothetical protein
MAYVAVLHIFLQSDNGIAELLGPFLIGLKQVKHQPQSRFATNARQSRKGLNRVFDQL